MSNLKIKGNDSGTGNVTLQAPNTNTDVTLTLPSSGDVAGTASPTFTGNVGIGTSSPAWKLDVVGTGVVRTGVSCTDNHAAGAGVYLRTFNSGVQVSNATMRTDNAGNFSVFTGTSGETEHMRIDSSGRVTMPYQVGFKAYSTGFTHTSSWVHIGNSINTVDYNIGNHFNPSTGYFTAPVDGTYEFFFGGWSAINSSGGRYATNFRKNGGSSAPYLSGANYCSVDSPLSAHSEYIKLSAGDFVALYSYSVSSGTWGGGHRVYWGCQLVG